jgi:hypothetical protein
MSIVRKIGDHILVPFANANSACLSANDWITKCVPITYHSIPAIIVQGSLAESCGKWGEENAIYVIDAKHIPGVYTAADIYDVEKYVSHELFGDGNAYTFCFEVEVEQLFTAGEKNKSAGIYNREDCRIMSLVIERVSIFNADCDSIWIGEGEDLGFVGPTIYADRCQLSQEQIKAEC